MSEDAIKDTEALAKAYGVEFKDCGDGHVQLRGHGHLVNYWPNSKKKTLHSPTLNRRENHCTPWDAVRLCMAEAKKGMRPKKPTTNPANFDIKPVHTEAAVKHFYNGEIPPWDDSLGAFQVLTGSDAIRLEAWEMDRKAGEMRERADWLDDQKGEQ